MRDYQRQRVYNAENSIRLAYRGRDLPTVADMQTYVDDMLGRAWFTARFGTVTIEVRPGNGHRRAVSYGPVLQMPVWSRFELVLLHEVAHSLTDDHHGPAFTAVHQFLVGEMMGRDAAKALGDAYFDYNVDLDRRLIPAADPSRARRAREQKQKAAATARHLAAVARQAAANERTRPATRSELSAAADTIRRAAKHGVFGPAGATARTQALATARLLAKA